MPVDIAEDFPAAHSMDTAWFGVDDAGEIAVFDTGPDAAVPVISKDRELHWLGWQDLFSKCPEDDKGFRRIPVDGRPLAALCDPGMLTVNLKSCSRWFFVAVFASDGAVVPAPTSDDGISRRLHLRFSGPDIVVLYEGVAPLAGIQRIAKEGGVVGVAPAWDNISRFDCLIEAQGVTKTQAKAALKLNEGLWGYRGKCSGSDNRWLDKYLGVHGYSGHSTFYQAAFRPRVPLKLSDFSIEEIEHTGFVPLPGIRFADTAAIQPFAFMDCTLLGKIWVGADGSFHHTIACKYGKLCERTYKNCRLCGENGEPLNGEAWRRIAIRPAGVLPVPIDHEAWGNFKNST
jgi:hypothetical protein